MMEAEARYCLRCGTALVPQFLFNQLRPACPGCGWIYFSDPKVAVAALVTRREKVLLVQRLNEPQRGFWSLPAGFVDAGEDPARAAERECQEETGLTVRVSRLLDVIPGKEHPRGADILIVYAAEILTGEARPGDDAGSIGFFAKDELPPLAFHSTRRILTVLFGE